MKKIIYLGITIIIGVIIVTSFIIASNYEDAPEKVQNFSLRDTEGVKHTLYDYEGRIIILFFMNAHSSSCEKQVDDLKCAIDFVKSTLGNLISFTSMSF